ncbi:MAG TPA: HAMP domain-containing sensor histidine kinase [Isosphaeraceae bacterium]
MDVRLAPTPVMEQAPGRSRQGQPELQAIVRHLGGELSRPLGTLQHQFDRWMTDAFRSVTPDQRGHLSTMAALCDDMQRLIRDYEDYTGLVLGIETLHPGPHRVRTLLQELDRRFAPRAASGGVAWACALVGPDALVAVDAEHVLQAVGHLVANALKFAAEGGRVAVSAGVEGPRWLVTVDDDGPGIPAEAHARVFEPFFRLPRDERASTPGHGLGLAICQELVDRMNGEIALTSEDGKGTRVTINLPVGSTRPETPRPKGR